MAITSPTSALTNDHLDLLVTAAQRWRVLPPHTEAAFTAYGTGSQRVEGDPSRAGQQLREENSAAMLELARRGRGRAADRLEPAPYIHRPVITLDPVEVIKATHAAQHLCEASPNWAHSSAKTLLASLIIAATHRLDGYADAPWIWSRPQRRHGRVLAITTADDTPPIIAGIQWLQDDQIEDHWSTASLVIVRVPAADLIPVSLPARAGVFVMATGESPEDIWRAVSSLNMGALVLQWPTCSDWLTHQLADPDPAYVEHRPATG